MNTSIWWVRRDLRLGDNQALEKAKANAERVIPLFILDPHLINSSYVGEKRLTFLFQGLMALNEQLTFKGSKLVVRKGYPLQVLKEAIEESGATTIYAQPDYSPYARKRDTKVSQYCPIEWIEGPVVHPPGSILTSNGKPYQIFTPFRKKWKALPLPDKNIITPQPKKIPTPDKFESLSLDAVREILKIPSKADTVGFKAGEIHAQTLLTEFINSRNGIHQYAQLRDRLDIEGTSKLSPYFRFGMLSARQAIIAAKEAIQNAADRNNQKGAQTWLNELIWREFYVHILYHFPEVRSQNFRLKNIAWENNEENFSAWCYGKTGYPLIDAAMRQLKHSGWMHNRARMIVASFLTKDLLINWRWGERWFMAHLIDGDPAANNGGWQWAASTGTDAVPYFRIFNPITQSEKYDPHGTYIRRWIPELKNVSTKFIHAPWKMDKEEQEKAGCIIGEDYPAPIVEHQWARQRALNTFKQARK